ncbi:glycine cleavage system aminomethyltransferase GcvT [Marinivivus vitaminiproducens]|uniref:glycine cleavage system aminomethyltransferase GcvT n=1 Tax=Marinivivus vitaminiproducens TaxID=3035935 RepID=UPI002798DB63|nr:glycine cleavage system aminomethyltransferase GcvT [Geminicoccaceae bacterium SCSIO 64248]
MTESDLRRTPLYDLHVRHGGRMVPFAGWEMPVQYPLGILKEHLHCRSQASLFDVSHMGQVVIRGDGVLEAFEALVPAAAAQLPQGRLRYTQLTDEQGGILDDLIFGRLAADRVGVVVNAGCRDADIAHMRAKLPGFEVVELAERALLALQGPAAAPVMERLAPETASLRFMATAEMTVAGIPCGVSRSGYTGEDGFEISVDGADAAVLAERLLAESVVEWAGLGARDSLRLEAGLPLYGHDIDTGTTPVEAGLAWSIQKRRREQGCFPGHETILRQLRDGPARKLVGIKTEGRAPAREGTAVADAEGREIGKVTSGGFGPSVNGPVAMGYVESAFAEPGTPVQLMIRGKASPAAVQAMPFVPHRYVR